MWIKTEWELICYVFNWIQNRKERIKKERRETKECFDEEKKEGIKGTDGSLIQLEWKSRERKATSLSLPSSASFLLSSFHLFLSSFFLPDWIQRKKILKREKQKTERKKREGTVSGGCITSRKLILFELVGME